MKVFLTENKKWLIPGAFLAVLAGIGMIVLGLTQTLTLIVDGDPVSVRTPALTISGALRSAGVAVDDEDRILPSIPRMFWEQPVIRVESAREILVRGNEDEFRVVSAERIPANILAESGIQLYPQDRLLVNGEAIDPHQPLAGDGPIFLQIALAVPVNVTIDDQEMTLYTSQPTLGEALETAGIILGKHDRVSTQLTSPVDSLETVSIRRARAITVETPEITTNGMTAANTVGDALLEIGVPLQNLDYSIPAGDMPVPDDGTIEVVRVREAVMLMTDEVAFNNEYVEDPDTVLDQISVIEPGQKGIFATRERVKFENGEEAWRSPQENWQASEAKDGVLGYGSKVEIRTAVVDGQEIEYWRKITVYATAYSPCRSGVDRCLYGTATGILPVQKGVVAVTPRWISVPNGYGMWGQSVYIPGYGRGVIADTGGGIPGTPWIDLAYSDDDYVSWNRWTTMYFLTPVPPWAPPILVP